MGTSVLALTAALKQLAELAATPRANIIKVGTSQHCSPHHPPHVNIARQVIHHT
jgi:hypothetical protein